MPWSSKSAWAVCFGFLWVINAWLAPGESVHAAARQPVSLALLPFENVSGSARSPAIIMPMVEEALVGKGYRLVAPKELEPFLFQNRVRNTGMISRAHLSGLRDRFSVRLAMVGSVDLFHASDDSGDTPQWGLSSRVVSSTDGSIFWADSVGFTGDDFTGILGLGRITSVQRLGEQTVRVLLRGIPRAGEPFLVPGRAKPGLVSVRGLETGCRRYEHGEGECQSVPLNERVRGFRASYRSPELDLRPPRRVAVLPFNNVSERRGAGRILTDVLTTALFRRGRFEVIEPGEVNETLIALKVASFGTIDFASLSGLRKRTGADAVILGTIYAYNEGLNPRAKTTPEVELDVRMLSTESGKVLWAALHGRAGDDYQIVLDFGIVSSMVPLILRVVGEMLETL